MLRPIGSMPPLAALWNRDFTRDRRDNAKRFMSRNMRCTPKGRGNRAWKRVDAMFNDPAVLVWPDYAL